MDNKIVARYLFPPWYPLFISSHSKQFSSLFTILFLLGFFISISTTLVRECFSARAFHMAVKTNQRPLEIPLQECTVWLLVLDVVKVPFGLLFSERLFIMSTLLMARVYYCVWNFSLYLDPSCWFVC